VTRADARPGRGGTIDSDVNASGAAERAPAGVTRRGRAEVAGARSAERPTDRGDEGGGAVEREAGRRSGAGLRTGDKTSTTNRSGRGGHTASPGTASGRRSERVQKSAGSAGEPRASDARGLAGADVAGLAEQLIAALDPSADALERWMAAYVAECLTAATGAAASAAGAESRARAATAIRELWTLQLARTERRFWAHVDQRLAAATAAAVQHARARRALRRRTAAGRAPRGSRAIARDLRALAEFEREIFAFWDVVRATGEEVEVRDGAPGAALVFVRTVARGDLLRTRAAVLGEVLPRLATLDPADPQAAADAVVQALGRVARAQRRLFREWRASHDPDARAPETASAPEAAPGPPQRRRRGAAAAAASARKKSRAPTSRARNAHDTASQPGMTRPDAAPGADRKDRPPRRPS